MMAIARLSEMHRKLRCTLSSLGFTASRRQFIRAFKRDWSFWAWRGPLQLLRRCWLRTMKKPAAHLSSQRCCCCWCWRWINSPQRKAMSNTLKRHQALPLRGWIQDASEPRRGLSSGRAPPQGGARKATGSAGDSPIRRSVGARAAADRTCSPAQRRRALSSRAFPKCWKII